MSSVMKSIVMSPCTVILLDGWDRVWCEPLGMPFDITDLLSCFDPLTMRVCIFMILSKHVLHYESACLILFLNALGTLVNGSD